MANPTAIRTSVTKVTFNVPASIFQLEVHLLGGLLEGPAMLLAETP